jgi:hypothetical protein
MAPSHPRPLLSRRQFLGLLAGAGVTAAGAYIVNEAAPWLDYSGQIEGLRRPFNTASTGTGQLHEIVRYATLAANGHNTQPWHFAIGDNTIEIRPDHTRRLKAVDPDDRELWISLGCALENLTLAARAAGYASTVRYPQTDDVIGVDLMPERARSGPLFDAIPRRQSTRSVYDGQPLPAGVQAQIEAVELEPEVATTFITQRDRLETVVEYVDQGNRLQYADRAFVNELIAWLRFNKREALASGDGLFAACSGNPEVPRWLGQLVVSGTDPAQQAETDAERLRSASGVVLVCSQRDDKPSWVQVGQVYQRLALQMTALDVRSAFLNQPIEVASLRDPFQAALGLGAWRPQVLVRFGRAGTAPFSARRAVTAVISASPDQTGRAPDPQPGRTARANESLLR